jgi:tetratricopeptide (TPR) repeat protein
MSSESVRSGNSPVAGLRRLVGRYFRDAIVVLITLTVSFTSAVSYLQNTASHASDEANRKSQAYAIQAMGHNIRALQSETYQESVYDRWDEWDRRRIIAGYNDAEEAARSQAVADAVKPQTVLLAPPYIQQYQDGNYYADTYAYYADTNLITTTLLSEQRAALADEANGWSNKASSYVTVLTFLAVVLFLYGLSTTIAGSLRFIFALVATAMAGVSMLWTLVLFATPVSRLPEAAINEYAQAIGSTYEGNYKEAITRLDKALGMAPDYVKAYVARADAFYYNGDIDRAIDDMATAVRLGGKTASNYWNLGWYYYLQGKYEESVEASRAALALNPGELGVKFNVAIALLADGRFDEAFKAYEEGIAAAADHERTPDATRRLWMRLAIEDLDALVAVLDNDGATEGYWQPRVGTMQNREAVHEKAVAARKRMKEANTSLEYRDTAQVEPTGAVFGLLTFSDSEDGELATTFPDQIQSVYVFFDYSQMQDGWQVARKVYRDGSEYNSLNYEYEWALGESGNAQWPIYDELRKDWGLRAGLYTVEYYVEGELVQSGSFKVE